MFALTPLEERHAVRRSVRLGCQVVSESRFRLVGKRCLDLSQTGMLIECDDDVAVGDELLVSFRIPGTSRFFDLSGRAARIVSGKRPLDAGRCLGVRFEGLDVRTRAILGAMLRGLPPPVPTRAPRVDYAATVSSLAAS